MSEQKHTPEPWRVECDEYDYGNDGYQARAWPTVWAGEIELIGTEGFYSELGREVDIVNARRIVACVNACAGMSDEAMELAVENGGMKAVIGFARDLERQRDQLLAALKEIAETNASKHGTVSLMISRCMDIANSAMAAVEGGNQS